MNKIKRVIAVITLISVVLSINFIISAEGITDIKGDNKINPNEYRQVIKIDEVFFDNDGNYYGINCIDKNGEEWSIELFEAQKENKLILNNLIKTFKGLYIYAIFDNEGTKRIEDDQIINWTILDK